MIKMQWLISLCLLLSLTVQAQTGRTLELEKQRKRLLSEIENTNKLLSENKRSISTIVTRLELVKQQIRSRKQLLEVLETEILALNGEIREKERQTQVLEKQLQLKKETYAKAVRRMYRQKDSREPLLFILSADHLAQSFRRILYLKEYTEWRKKQAAEIVAQQDQLSIERKKLLERREEKEMLADVRKNEEKKLQEEESVRKTEAAALQKNDKKLRADLAKKKKQANTLNREIEKIIAEEMASARLRARSQPDKGGKAETAGGFAMTKEERALSAGFAGNKGRLPFPLKGNYRIVERFGVQSYGNMKNIQVHSNGIKIKTTPGNTAKAVFNGTVSRTFVVPGYQASVIIRHGNYLTLYSHLEQVYVKRGDTVKTGQDIGKIYTDAEDKETILYFELWKEQTKLNPEPWLNK
ncbi:MAG: peptidoglycan DD-metalloendopeptidase family protein [Dysgonamonadaceae bacterium]|jgi:septal ring factor EnvC (AmiA/AmiB activator)|nr:peptidoglycan DD-metalloendopeptidase family protein [Dysgonamonadaceae bacterium]